MPKKRWGTHVLRVLSKIEFSAFAPEFLRMAAICKPYTTDGPTMQQTDANIAQIYSLKYARNTDIDIYRNLIVFDHF
jgi:hypothetical protein